MGKKRTAHAYELELKRMIRSRTGEDCEEWLLPQIRATAMNMELLDKVQEELMSSPKLVTLGLGSTKQQKSEVSPLLAYYLKLQAEYRLQLQALGLNFNATPSKITENTKKGGAEHDKLSALLEGLK